MSNTMTRSNRLDCQIGYEDESIYNLDLERCVYSLSKLPRPGNYE
jgi:hypothetical protein